MKNSRGQNVLFVKRPDCVIHRVRDRANATMQSRDWIQQALISCQVIQLTAEHIGSTVSPRSFSRATHVIHLFDEHGQVQIQRERFLHQRVLSTLSYLSYVCARSGL